MVKRELTQKLEKYISSGNHKIQFVWGPRRSGKSTILKLLSEKYGVKIFNFELVNDRQFFTNDIEVLKKLCENNKIILIDEVQEYPESTVALKIIYDTFPNKVIATGSTELRVVSLSDYDSLSGRFDQHYCYPLSLKEIVQSKEQENTLFSKDKLGIEKDLKDLIIWGGYPEVFTEKDDLKKITYIDSIIDTYILKDIVNIYKLKDIKLVKDMLVLLALQIGQEISLTSLSSRLGIDKKTLSSYLEILSKNCILIPLPPYESNVKKSISTYNKYYFWDIGLRNALVKDFREIDLRQDKGMVLENFVISEYCKNKEMKDSKENIYYYRDYSLNEVDIVTVDYFKNIKTFEIKYKERKLKNNVPELPTPYVISMSNLAEFLLK